MQFIKLPKPIDIAERGLPELVADWVDTQSVQNINIVFLSQLPVNMLVFWATEWLTIWLAHGLTFRNFTLWAWAIWDLSKYDVFWTIPDPWSQQRVTLSPECNCSISFQASAHDVNLRNIMCLGYVSYLQSNYHCQAWNWVQRQAVAVHPLTWKIRFWCFPVHASDVDPSMVSFAG